MYILVLTSIAYYSQLLMTFCWKMSIYMHSPSLFKAPIPRPNLPPFSRSLSFVSPTPIFSLPPTFEVFQIVSPTLKQSPPALIQKTNLPYT